MRKILVAVLLGLALAIPASITTASPAAATDSFDTNYHMKCGVNIPFGYYCQLTFTKSASNTMKKQAVAGASVAAIAAYACGKIPSWITEAWCVLWLARNTVETRDAFNDAYGNSQHCVAIRWYSAGPSNDVARHADDVTCNFGVACCSDGSSGGGGGAGGGGSWRERLRHVTMTTDRHPVPEGPGNGGGGGGSW